MLHMFHHLRKTCACAAVVAAAGFLMMSPASITRAHAATASKPSAATSDTKKTAPPEKTRQELMDEAFQEGRTAYNKGDWGLTIATLRPLAEEGDARAMILVGNLYAEGHGVKQNYREAYTLYRRAAFHDNADAMVALGAMYQNGLGATKNVPLAIEWFHRAARLGSQAAQMMFALHSYRGYKTDDGSFDMKPNKIEAYKWFRIAATHGEDRKIRHAAYSLGLKVSTEIKEYEANEVNQQVDKWAPDTPDSIGPNPEQAAIDAQKKKILEGDLTPVQDKTAAAPKEDKK